MYLIPLNQVESVELVIHALKAAGGMADCDVCPARRVCMKQCLTIAAAVEKMFADGSLPALTEKASGEETKTRKSGARKAPEAGPTLKIIK